MATTTAVHSPAAIERARSAALTALAAVNEAKPIPDSGGLLLCPEMRLWRATEILTATDTSDARYPAIAITVGKLADHAQALDARGKAAIAEYTRLCQAAGQPPDTLPQPACQCDGHKLWTALEETRRTALWLLWPEPENNETYPTLAVLYKAQKTEYLDKKLRALADAQIAYTDACTRLGVAAQWGWVLR